MPRPRRSDTLERQSASRCEDQIPILSLQKAERQDGAPSGENNIGHDQRTANLGTSAPLLDIRNVAKSFGKNAVLRDISLQVAEGEFLTILGRKWFGQDHAAAHHRGFRERRLPARFSWAGERLDNLPPYRRRVNTVFQHYALFPHLTVAENVGYGLRVAKAAEAGSRDAGGTGARHGKDDGLRRCEAVQDQWRTAAAHRAGARPGEPSPRLLLLDEPLSALDANLRRQMQVELKSLQREVGISFVFVTHDQEEAMVMSDRIALLRMGELEQVASPREIYNRPATAYTAQFIGHTNLLSGEVKDGMARCQSLSWRTGLRDGPASSRCVRKIFGWRDRQRSATVRFRGKILRQAFHGATELLQVECADGLMLSIRTASRENWSGDVDLEFSPADAVPVRRRNPPCGEERQLTGLMFSRAYRAAITVPPLLWVAVFLLVPYALLFCYSFWSVSSSQDHRPFLDSGQLPPTCCR